MARESIYSALMDIKDVLADNGWSGGGSGGGTITLFIDPAKVLDADSTSLLQNHTVLTGFTTNLPPGKGFCSTVTLRMK